MRRIVFEGNAFYEVDEECEKKKKVPTRCNEKNLLDDSRNRISNNKIYNIKKRDS